VPLPTSTPQPAVALPDQGAAPELAGITGWFNTPGNEPLSLEGLRGKVVLIDFWTFGCYNCRNVRPYVRALYDKYHAEGLEIIGVHTPEFAYERVPESIEKAAAEQNVSWPIALDPDFKTWRAYRNGYWPALYFIDAKGHLRATYIGEGNYDKKELAVRQLLAEAKQDSR
jgi:thiol-disulfide isomerase/thioredoxin